MILLCAPPDLKKWHEACGGLNERLSNPSQGLLGRFISRDPIGHAGNLNLYAYPTNLVSYVDPDGLEPGSCPNAPENPLVELVRNGDSENISFVNGIGYWKGFLNYKFVPGITPNTISNATGYENATFADFVRALETSDNFVYTGHHFGNGRILLDDGYDNLANNDPARREGIQSASDLRSSDPVTNLVNNRRSDVPGIIVVPRGRGPYW